MAEVGTFTLNGCVAVQSIDSNKVLDAEEYSVECQLCKVDHINCKANFDGSALAMEAEMAKNI